MSQVQRTIITPLNQNNEPGCRHRHYLGVLIDFGSVLLITINIQSNGGPCTPGATQSEDDTRTICKYKPQALEKDKQRVFLENAERETADWQTGGVHVETQAYPLGD